MITVLELTLVVTCGKRSWKPTDVMFNFTTTLMFFNLNLTKLSLCIKWVLEMIRSKHFSLGLSEGLNSIIMDI